MGFFIATTSLLILVLYVVLKRPRSTRPQAQNGDVTPCDDLSIDEALLSVEGLIESGVFLVTKADEDMPEVHELGPVTRDFFARYRSLRTELGGFELSYDQIRWSEYVPGYLSIGHSEDWDVVQYPGKDDVFVVEGFRSIDPCMEAGFDSIYHLALDEISG